MARTDARDDDAVNAGKEAADMAVQAKGRVKRIYASYETRNARTYIALELPASTMAPKDGYFVLESRHPNYNALYSLALVAAVNRYELSIRAAAEITNQAHAQVEYMVVDW
jgi:hypothetical protein